MSAAALDPFGISPFLSDFVRAGQAVIDMDYFAYNKDLALQFGAPAPILIQTQSDSDFILTGLSRGQESSGLFSRITAQITDRRTGKTLFNQPTIADLVFGASGFPFVLPVPRVFMPNSVIQIDLVRLAAGSATEHLSLHGVRLYYASGADATAVGTPQ